MKDLPRSLGEQPAFPGATCSADSLARPMAGNNDALIRGLITEAIGSEWSLDSIKHRLSRVIVPGTPGEYFCLDGEPLIYFEPPTVETKREGDKLMIVATQRYTRLNPPNTQGVGRRDGASLAAGSPELPCS